MSATEDHSSHVNGRTVQQAPGLWRTDPQRHDLSVPGREVIQSRIGPEAPLVKHTHPGEEIIYILEGSLEFQIEGEPPVPPLRPSVIGQFREVETYGQRK